MKWITLLPLLIKLVMQIAAMFRKGKTGSSVPTSTTPFPAPDRPASPPATFSRDKDGGIGELFRLGKSDVVVEATGTIVKVLPDDEDTSDGSEMHQKFLVELPGDAQASRGVTVRVCHNLKFGHVPVNEGDTISFKGEYEWSDRGGTIHWTHHDPRGTHEDGFILHKGQRYE